MDFFSILSMIGGLALFLYGMHVMGDGLAKVSGGKMEKILESLTSNPLKAVGLGALVTAVIQSSSATTVMVVGFVNSGIMKLSQAVGVIMGANIGTTVTSWILSLSGIESDNFFVQLFKPASFSPVLAMIGVAFLLFAKSERKKDLGTIFLGFAVLMYGMEHERSSETSGRRTRIHGNSDRIQQSSAGYAGRRPFDGCDSKFFCVRGDSAGPLCHRGCQLRSSHSHYFGTEHRYLCDGFVVCHWRKEKRKARRYGTSVFQYHWHNGISGDILRSESGF